jgi:hypothetical protein
MLTKDTGSSEDEWMEMGDDDENSTEVGGDVDEDSDEEPSNSGTLNDTSRSKFTSCMLLFSRLLTPPENTSNDTFDLNDNNIFRCHN